jgi:hypothetical protein
MAKIGFGVYPTLIYLNVRMLGIIGQNLTFSTGKELKVTNISSPLRRLETRGCIFHDKISQQIM